MSATPDVLDPVARPLLEPVAPPLAWSGTDYAHDRQWAWRLSPAELEELRVASVRLGERNLDFANITANDFPLPTMAPRLAEMRRGLRAGRGFELIKGIQVDDYSEIELRRIFLGISAHLGTSVSQSYRGDYLGDVMDYREPGNERPYRRGGLLEMHRDPCDIVGLFCYRQAKWGGLSRVTSVAQVWNLMLAERPDLLEPLLDGFRLYITKDDRTGDSPVTAKRIPVFTNDPDGILHCTYIAELARSGVSKGNETFHPKAEEALDYFEAVANREGVYLDMAIERGDMQFLNNRTTVHGRTDYEDWPEADRRRMMFRVWLMCPEWPLPDTAVNRLLFGKIDRAQGGVGRRA